MNVHVFQLESTQNKQKKFVRLSARKDILFRNSIKIKRNLNIVR